MNDKPLLNPQTEKLIDQLAKELPSALILSGSQKSGVSEVARHIAERVGTIHVVIEPKKRNTSGQFVVDRQAGSIIIDDIRQLYQQTRARFTRPHIAIIDLAGRNMTVHAQNALLKLLEEPNEQVHIILIANTAENLLPTIRSRSAHVALLPITDDQTMTLLAQLSITDPVKQARIRFIAAGHPAEITRLATDTDYYALRTQTVLDAKTLLEADLYKKLATIARYKDKRPLALQLIDDAITQLTFLISKSPQSEYAHRIDRFLEARDHIAANGNIPLQLANVLL